jgi:hypothetical protein
VPVGGATTSVVFDMVRSASNSPWWLLKNLVTATMILVNHDFFPQIVFCSSFYQFMTAFFSEDLSIYFSGIH